VSREPQVEQPPRSFRRSLVVLLLVVVAPAVLVGLVAGGVAARAFPVGIVGGLLIITGAGPAAGVRFLVVLPVVLAVSLLTVGATSLVGFVQRARSHMVEFPTGLLFALAGMIGAPGITVLIACL
jgi:hypothetical protein